MPRLEPSNGWEVRQEGRAARQHRPGMLQLWFVPWCAVVPGLRMERTPESSWAEWLAVQAGLLLSMGLLMKWSKKCLLWLAFFVSAVVIGGILNAARPAVGEPVLLVIFFISLVSFLRYLVFGSALLPWPEEVGDAARWRVSVVAAAFVWGIPAISVVVATPNVSRNALIGYFIGPAGNQGLLGVPEALCVLGIPILFLLVPAWLHARGRPWRDGSPVPAWLAGIAAVLTAIALVLLHFHGGALAGLQPAVVSVAAFAPGSCWRRFTGLSPMRAGHAE